MKTSTTSGSECDALRELIPWYATGDLTAEERSRLDAHLHSCDSCQELVQFSTVLKETVASQQGVHPPPETLVLLGEDASQLAPQERRLVEQHLSQCTPCRDELAALQELDRVEAKPAAASRPGLRLFWEWLAGSLLRPVPAAAYLTVAAVLLVAVLRPAVLDPIRSLRGANPSVYAPVLGGVVLAPDGSGAVRGSPEVASPVIVDASRTEFLLLELADTSPPPSKDTLYRLEMTPAGSVHPTWTSTLEGGAFRENRTLCLLLPQRRLKPGLYTVAVTDPAGQAIYHSSLQVR